MLVVEEADAVGDHDHAVLVAGLDHFLVPKRSPALSNIGNTASGRPIDVVTEREEGVTGQAHP